MTIELSVTAIGSDRPGVVAAITGALADVDGNLEDTSMTILGGRFAMVLIVAVPDAVSEAQVEAALAGPAAELHLDVSVHRSDAPAAPPEGERFSVAVYGADRPGIVHRIAAVLAERGVNITDLTTRVVGGHERPVYAMLLDVTVPAGVDAADVERELHQTATGLGVECSVHPVDADIL
jgi:glycine cleavage system transcriptional repressor